MSGQFALVLPANVTPRTLYSEHTGVLFGGHAIVTLHIMLASAADEIWLPPVDRGLRFTANLTVSLTAIPGLLAWREVSRQLRLFAFRANLHRNTMSR
jgi:hypothetical protein